MAYPLVAVGALSGTPVVAFDGPLAPGMTAAVTSSGGVLGVTFNIDPYPAWAAGHGLTGDDALPTADPDGDGEPNLLEFATGQAPLARTTRPLALVAGPDASRTVEYTRGRAAFADGWSFVVERSTSLAPDDWQVIDIPGTVVGEDTLAERIAITLPSLASDRVFFRLRITKL